eukprot:c18447_g1_i1.p1 GENE.c18447_g1_i1~~c18447_g1_i1.p1  ORF type:complete len:152 (-),score=4.35 c18447_g1_i1:16-471(-)
MGTHDAMADPEEPGPPSFEEQEIEALEIRTLCDRLIRLLTATTDDVRRWGCQAGHGSRCLIVTRDVLNRVIRMYAKKKHKWTEAENALLREMRGQAVRPTWEHVAGAISAMSTQHVTPEATRLHWKELQKKNAQPEEMPAGVEDVENEEDE